MWELKNFGNPDYMAAFKDGAAFAFVAICISGFLIAVIAWLARLTA